MFLVSSYSFRIAEIPRSNLKRLESFWFLVSGFMLSENTLRKLETRNLKLETPLSNERRFMRKRVGSAIAAEAFMNNAG